MIYQAGVPSPAFYLPSRDGLFTERNHGNVEVTGPCGVKSNRIEDYDKRAGFVYGKADEQDSQ